ncbi:hypothetical protein FFZ77_21495 [Streptomyces katsurahamanus]|uniref:Uncharacterized protein n=1 Tax=Streptomyces katsurahamanus TaxID=2577098 RepID=A0ABW9NXP2_9ACTN|nr:hypothetical protein [Streptomyces katsurahamanus]
MLPLEGTSPGLGTRDSGLGTRGSGLGARGSEVADRGSGYDTLSSASSRNLRTLSKLITAPRPGRFPKWT